MTQSYLKVQAFDDIVGNKDPIHVVQIYAKEVVSHYYDVGMLLYVIKENELYHNVEKGKYVAENHKLWKQFVEEQIPDIGYRTAQYWINMWHYFWSMNKSKADLDGIGWAKAKELVNVTEDGEVLDELLEFAKDNTIEALKAEIQKHLPTEKKKDPVFKLNLKTSVAIGETITEALSLSKKVNDSGDDNAALIEIIVEWYQLKSAMLTTQTYTPPEPDFE